MEVKIKSQDLLTAPAAPESNNNNINNEIIPAAALENNNISSSAKFLSSQSISLQSRASATVSAMSISRVIQKTNKFVSIQELSIRKSLEDALFDALGRYRSKKEVEEEATVVTLEKEQQKQPKEEDVNENPIEGGDGVKEEEVMGEDQFSSTIQKSIPSVSSINLHTFQDFVSTNYSQNKSVLLLTKDWMSGLSPLTAVAAPIAPESEGTTSTVISEAQLLILEKRYNEKMRLLQNLKESFQSHEVFTMEGGNSSFTTKDLIILNKSDNAAATSKKTLVFEDEGNAHLRAEHDPLLLPKKKKSEHHFQTLKNPVLLKVDSPGVMEVDWIPGVSAEKKDNSGQEKNSFSELTMALASHRKMSLQNHRFGKPAAGSELTIFSLVAEPKVVVFDSYTPYRTVTKTLTIKNVSKYSHRFRVSFNPPGEYPEFFGLEIQKTPINHDGLIAPGLSCFYTVSFTPNSLGNTEVELIVTSENGESFIVPVLARRENPEMQIPAVLDIGFCMEGRELIYERTFQNLGGEGRFSLMKPNIPLGPFEIFEDFGLRRDIEQASVTFAPFTIFPSFLAVNHGDGVDFSLKYAPTRIKKGTGLPDGDVHSSKSHISVVKQRKDSQKIKFACDNCTVLEVTIVATVQEPKVDAVFYQCQKGMKELVSLESSLGEDYFKVDLGDENLGVPKTAILRIKNPTNLSIPFEWKPAGGEGIHISHLLEIAPYHSNIFTISPASGCIEPLAEMEFLVTFLSNTAKFYTSIMEMVIPTENHFEKFKPLARMQLFGNGVAFKPTLSTFFVFLPQGLKVGDDFQKSIHFTNESMSDISYEWEIIGINPDHIKIEMSSWQGVVAPDCCVKFGFKAIGLFPCSINGELRCRTSNGLGPTLILPVVGSITYLPQDLTITTDFIDLGLLKLGESTTETVQLKNSSRLTMKYLLKVVQKDEVNDCYLRIEPSEGELQPGEIQNITLYYLPLWYQQFRGTLQIFTKSEAHDSQSLSLLSAVDIVAITETPQLKIVNDKNDMTAFVGVPFSWKIALQNTRELPAEFNFPDQICSNVSIHCEPRSGIVKAHSLAEVKITMNASVGGVYETDIVGKAVGMVEGNGSLRLKVKLQVFEPTFSLRVLENEEAWNNVAKDLKASEGHKNPSDASLRLDFGISCPIFAEKTRTLVIRNNSPRPSPFDISIEKYKPTLPDSSSILPESDAVVKEVLPARYGAKSSAPQLLQVTIDPRHGFSSKGGQAFVDGLNKFREVLESMKRILSDGRGAAFHVVPSSGIVPAWGKVVIKVNSYNNLVGLYEDWLTCNVGNICRRLPIRLGVVGIAVKFTGPQLVSKSNPSKININPLSNFDLVNFGTRVINPKFGPNDGIRLAKGREPSIPNLLVRKAASISMLSHSAAARRLSLLQQKEIIPFPNKKINVENHSPREIRLEWVVYVKHSDKLGERTDEDAHLSEIIQPGNRLLPNDVGVIDIAPAVMIIPPFKSAVLQCNFRNCCLGAFDSVVLADIAYVSGVSKDTIKYGPRRISKNGEVPQEVPVLSEDMETIAVKDLDVIAKLRIKGKCIEPKLSLDFGSKIRIQKALRHTADTADLVSLQSVVFLINSSDAVCSFQLHVEPEHLFAVKATKKNQQVKKGGLSGKKDGEWLELKQKQQLMITVSYIGNPVFDDLSKKKRSSISVMDLRSRSFLGNDPLLPQGQRTSLMDGTGAPVSVNKRGSLAPPTSAGDTLERHSTGAGRYGSVDSAVSTPQTPPFPSSDAENPIDRDTTTKLPPILSNFAAHQNSRRYRNRSSTIGNNTLVAASATPAIKLETGSLIIHHSNGMIQELQIDLEGVYG